MNPLTPQLFRFDNPGDSPQKGTPEMPIQTISYCPTSLHKAGITVDVEEIRGYHLSSPCLPWIMGSKVIGVWCGQPRQCHHCQTGQKAPGIPDMENDVERLEPT